MANDQPADNDTADALCALRSLNTPLAGNMCAGHPTKLSCLRHAIISIIATITNNIATRPESPFNCGSQVNMVSARRVGRFNGDVPGLEGRLAHAGLFVRSWVGRSRVPIVTM
eukprot:361200-Chlamydomonas_euryale.AAC.23